MSCDFNLFAHLNLVSSDSFSSLLFSSLAFPAFVFSSVHIVGRLTSKLPSVIQYQFILLRDIVAVLGLRQSMSESNAKLGVSRHGMRFDAMGCNRVGGHGL